MLTVPATIQALFKTDSVRKNFRVHFPNGENSDLTNSDIVSGSVRFTESVSSKDVLQFGLAESPRIEFECVNVQNIYGMTIECGIEIDTTSLSAAQITAIQGNPGDGTLVLAADSDIGYGFYRIPYGVFTVTSCPRSAGAMWKRRVEAYADAYVDSTQSSRILNNYYSDKETISVDAVPLAMSVLNSDFGLTLTETTISMTTGSTDQVIKWTYSGTTYCCRFVGTSAWSNKLDYYYPKDAFRFTCDIEDFDYSDVFDTVRTYGITATALNSLQRYILSGLEFYNSLDTEPMKFLAFGDLSDSGYFYTPKFNLTAGAGLLSVHAPVGGALSFYVEGNEANPIDSWTLPNYTNMVLKRYQIPSPLNSLVLIAKSSFKRDNSNFNSFIGSIDFNGIRNGMLELFASFGCVGRLNTPEKRVLSKSSPISVNTTEYADLWWDEYDIAPIGSATITYFDIDQNAEQTIVYDFGNGASEYDMTDNYLLKNLAVSASGLNGQTVEEFVTNLLDTYFIPNIGDIAFTPVQLDALGQPYLEAGDYLEIDDGNSGTVGTYIMNRTISGEQFLEDSIESQGGEIIGNARSA